MMIKRIDNSTDVVQSNINCLVTKYNMKKKVTGETKEKCGVTCSYAGNRLILTPVGLNKAYNFNLDDIMEIMKVAAEAARTEKEVPKPSDKELEDWWVELDAVPFVEADSPSGLVLAMPWRVFPAGVDRTDIWEFFDKNHSKGVFYLNELKPNSVQHTE